MYILAYVKQSASKSFLVTSGDDDNLITHLFYIYLNSENSVTILNSGLLDFIARSQVSFFFPER